MIADYSINFNTKILSETQKEMLDKIDDITKDIEEVESLVSELNNYWEGGSYQTYKKDVGIFLDDLRNTQETLKTDTKIIYNYLSAMSNSDIIAKNVLEGRY